MATLTQKIDGLTDMILSLMEQVENLEEKISEMSAKQAVSNVFYDAGRAHGEAAAREALMGKAHSTETAKPLRDRPRHLQSV